MRTRIVLGSLFLVAAGMSHAQISPVGAATSLASGKLTPFTFELGFFRSQSIPAHAGGDTHLSGLEFGVSQSFLSLPVVGELRVGGSVVLGRTFGGGANGQLYRLRGLYKTPSVGPNGAYGLVGLNFQSVQSSAFSNESGVGMEFGVGIPLPLGIPKLPSPALEIGYRLGPSNALRGFSAGVSVKF